VIEGRVCLDPPKDSERLVGQGLDDDLIRKELVPEQALLCREQAHDEADGS